MALVESASYSHSHHSLTHAPRDPSWITTSPSLSRASHACAQSIREPESADRFDLAAELDAIRIDGIGALSTLDSFGTLGILRPNRVELDSVPSGSRERGEPSRSAIPSEDPGPLEDELSPHTKRPFKKWMKSLHRRAALRPSVLGRRHLPLHLLEPSDVDRAALAHRQHRPSSSGSSYGFVAAVRSASVSLASVSSVARSKSRKNTARSRISRTDRSSRASMSATRVSEDSACLERQPKVDLAAAERAIQRRRILEEIISTEEGYIGDIRFLINVYVTILASLPSQAVGLRSSINRNLTDIVELHEEILSELHRVVPDSEYTQGDLHVIVPSSSHVHTKIHGHRRWRSLDAVPENEARPVVFEQPRGLLADPQTAADVARIFGKRMNKFFIYKEYGAKYDMMTTDITSAHASMPDWESYQRGLEALASTVGSSKTGADELKKSLSLADLLMKPIQRICRYPLLFSELLKHTTVVDCPNSHMEVESTLTRLREATAEINRATDDPQVRATLEKTWLLQDRLVFPQRKLDAVTRNQIRSFGRIHLCGAIYVCWQTKSGVEGQYMVALLYQDVLCLASAGKVDPIYTIMACISLDRAKIEEVDNGRGLQCHTAPFAWKLVFECDCALYEMVMTACSAAEAEEWCSRLKRSSGAESQDTGIFSSQELNMKSLGTVFGKQGTIARRLSVQRAITVTPKSPMCQVVVKNTSAVRDRLGSSSSTLAINRSQSLLTTNSRIPVLAPPRAERARLELLLSDVWSRDILPFPGITNRPKNEHLVRASSVMRKISMASFTGSFNKRTGSVSRRGARPCEDESAEFAQVAATLQGEDCIASKDDPLDPPEVFDLDSTIKVKRPRMQETVTCPAKVPTKHAGDAKSTVQQVKADDGLEKIPWRQPEKLDPRTMQVLQKSSTNSLCLTASVPSVKAPSGAVEKENIYEGVKVKPTTGSRWPKVSKPKGADKGHGFRNFFR